MDKPAGWTLFHLRDITFESRKRAATDGGLELPVFGVNNQTGLGTNSKYHATKLNRYKIVRPGMFAYNPMRLNIGSIGYCKQSLGGGLVSPDYVIFGCKEEMLDSRFLYYCTQQHHWQDWMRRAGAGSVRIRIYFKDIGKYFIYLPPLPEQRKIVDILSTWDEAIARTERLIVALKQRKKGLMQRLLTGQVRSPGFGVPNYQTSSEFPTDWTIMEFGDFVSRVSSKFNPASSDKIYPCIELEHLSRGTGKILSSISTEQQKSIKNVFRSGQVLFGKLRPYLKKYARPDFDGVCSSEIWVLDGKKKACNNLFLYYLVQTDRFLRIANITSGTKMPRSDWEYVSEGVFGLPSIAEQKKIADILHACDVEIDLQFQRLVVLKRQKKGLMQRLLTGKVRVKVE